MYSKCENLEFIRAKCVSRIIQLHLTINAGKMSEARNLPGSLE